MSTVPQMDRRELAAIFGGGALGAAVRIAIVNDHPAAGTAWPSAVFAINISGALLLGFVVTRLQQRRRTSPYRRALLGTGFCGAYTTFSTMQLELLTMIDHHRYGLAVGYAVASVTAGYLAIFLGANAARRVRVGR